MVARYKLFSAREKDRQKKSGARLICQIPLFSEAPLFEAVELGGCGATDMEYRSFTGCHNQIVTLNGLPRLIVPLCTCGIFDRTENAAYLPTGSVTGWSSRNSSSVSLGIESCCPFLVAEIAVPAAAPARRPIPAPLPPPASPPMSAPSPAPPITFFAVFPPSPFPLIS